MYAEETFNQDPFSSFVKMKIAKAQTFKVSLRPVGNLFFIINFIRETF